MKEACLPQQQDTRAKVCPKHVELILEINKTVIVASSWFLYYPTCIATTVLNRQGFVAFLED